MDSCGCSDFDSSSMNSSNEKLSLNSFSVFPEILQAVSGIVTQGNYEPPQAMVELNDKAYPVIQINGCKCGKVGFIYNFMRKVFIS